MLAPSMTKTSPTVDAKIAFVFDSDFPTASPIKSEGLFRTTKYRQ
jgi:hypothetical protein